MRFVTQNYKKKYKKRIFQRLTICFEGCLFVSIHAFHSFFIWFFARLVLPLTFGLRYFRSEKPKDSELARLNTYDN